jgi:hypothetical protein
MSHLACQWTFLSGPRRTIQKDLDIQEYTDSDHDRWFRTRSCSSRDSSSTASERLRLRGRPSVEDLWRELRAATSEIRPDWDLSTPGLGEPWDAGDHSPLSRMGQAVR